MQRSLPSGPPTAPENHLLAYLPDSDWQRLQPNLQAEFVALGRWLYDADSDAEAVFLPTTALVALRYVMADGSSAEVAQVGSDGCVGVALFMGGTSTPGRAVVQSPGWAYPLTAQTIKDEFARGGAMQQLQLRYTQALITQMAQTAVCNRHHSIDQQLCRWLLMSLDRLPSNDIAMTQELIADTLGVRREGVAEAAGKLQSSGVIRSRRGHITVFDRAALEKRCCECYGVVKRESDRLLPRPRRSAPSDPLPPTSLKPPREFAAAAPGSSGTGRRLRDAG